MHLQNGEDKDRRKRGFGNDGSRKGRGDGKRDDLYATWRRKTKAGHPDARRARDDGGQSKTSLSNRRDHRKLRHAPATPNAHAQDELRSAAQVRKARGIKQRYSDHLKRKQSPGKGKGFSGKGGGPRPKIQKGGKGATSAIKLKNKSKNKRKVR